MTIERLASTRVRALAAIAALAGCDALIGLGEAPPQDGAGATTTSSSTGPTSSTGEPGSTGSGSSSGGGEGGATTSASSSGGGGSGGSPAGAPCGTCTANPTSCSVCVEAEDRCALRTWRLPDTDGSAGDTQGIINRYGRNFAVTDDAIVFTRNVKTGGVDPSRHVASVVSRAAGESGGDDLVLAQAPGIGTAAASASGRIVVSEVGLANGPIHEVVLGGTPSLEEEISAFQLTKANRVGPLIWSGQGDRFLYAHRFAGNLFGFDIDQGLGPCMVSDVATTYSAPSDIARDGSEIAILRYAEAFVERGNGVECGAPALEDDSPTEAIVAANAVAIEAGDTIVQGLTTELASATRRTDGRGASLASYPSAALAARDGFVYVPDPQGGIRKCPIALNVDNLNDCETLADAATAGRGALFEATDFGLIAIGYDGPDATESLGDTIVLCIDER